MDVVCSMICPLARKLLEMLRPQGSSDEHASHQESLGGLKPRLLEISGSTWFREDWGIFVHPKYVLDPPGGIWEDTESEHSRCQGSNKLKDVPWNESRTLFSYTALVAFWCAWQNLHDAQAGSQTIITGMVAICLVCTFVILFKAQADRNLASASRDSEFLFVASYKETTEPEINSCSDSMATIIAVAKTPATWLVGSASTHHATGNRALLSGFKSVDGLNIHTGDGVRMPVRGRGCVITDTVVLPDVLFVPELKKNIVSVSQLTQLGCSIVFKRDACYISAATDGTTIGKALVGEDGMFKLEFLKVPLVN